MKLREHMLFTAGLMFVAAGVSTATCYKNESSNACNFYSPVLGEGECWKAKNGDAIIGAMPTLGQGKSELSTGGQIGNCSYQKGLIQNGVCIVDENSTIYTNTAQGGSATGPQCNLASPPVEP